MKENKKPSLNAIIHNTIQSNDIYTSNQILEVVRKALPEPEDYIVTSKKIEYYNIPCAFDIETSSFYQNGDKVAIMYIWQFGFNGLCVTGRTWEEFTSMMKQLSTILDLSTKKRLVVGVHNLQHEFQFIRHWFTWDNVFSIDARKPCYAVTDSGIEFRCTLILSAKSLQKVGEDLRTFNIQKKVGDLDYSQIRHSQTIISNEEIGYCVNDIKIVMAYLQEQIEQNDNNITNIPLTNTGYVRRYCKNECLSQKKEEKYSLYKKIIRSLTIEPEEFELERRAFAGGFTHSNPHHTNKVMLNVSSDDLTSSYPTAMVSECLFPMSKGEKIIITSMEEFRKNLRLYACIFDVELIGVTPKILYDNYISYSKCFIAEDCVLNNGRVVSAGRICLSVTEIDFELIERFYHIEHISVGLFYRYRRGYLPTKLVKAILELYRIKTEYKGIAEKEFEYNLAKSQLNSTYGMMCFNPIRPEITYSDEWGATIPDLSEALESYNNSYGRFTTYTWSLYVTAIARRNLMSALLEFKDDYVYSDTDSIKAINRNNHLQYFENYNDQIRQKLYDAMDRHGLPHDLVEPADKNGIKHLLGVWDFEGYKNFKTLGAKRYMTEKNGEYSITIAGLSKKVAKEWFLNQGKNPFDVFTDLMEVPEEFTGKLTHTYIDDERKGIVTDYLGKSCEYYEKSAVHLEPTSYSLNMAKNYLDYLARIDTDFT